MTPKAITPAEPIEPAAAQSSIKQLEAAALNHRIETFARELERVLSISRPLAHRMVTDPSGDRVLLFNENGKPLGVGQASRALSVPTGIAVIDLDHAVVANAGNHSLAVVSRTANTSVVPK